MASIETIGIEFDTSGLQKGQVELQKTEQAANKASSAADGFSGAAKKSGEESKTASVGVGSLGSAIAALGLGVAASEAIKMADAYTQMNARLSLVTKSAEELESVQSALFTVAQITRTDLGATVDMYTALARSTKDLGLTQQQLLTVTETFNKAIIVSGASTQAAQAAITQFNQAMASGVLRGEEFNSISEQAPRIMDMLASSLGKTRGELREMAQAGQLTSDVVLPAILKGAEDVSAEFDQMPVTVSQAMQQAQNSLLLFVGEIDKASGSSSSLAGIIQDASVIIDAMSESVKSMNSESSKSSVIQTAIAVVFETLLVLGANVAYVIKEVAAELGAMAAQGAALARLDFAAFKEIGKIRTEDAKLAREEIDKMSASILNARDKAEQANTALKNSGMTAADVSQEMKRLGASNDVASVSIKASTQDTKAQADELKKAQKEVEKQEAEYAKLTSSIDAKIMSSQAEIESTGKLTDATKMLDKVYADMWAGTLLLTDAQIDETTAKLEALDVLQRHIDMKKEEKKLQDQISQDTQQIIETIQKRTDTMTAENDKIKEQNLILYMGKDAYEALTIQRMLDEAQQLESIATTSDQSAELLKQANILRERAAMSKEGIILKEAREAADAWEKTTKSIGDGLSSALLGAVTSGRDIWLTFRDYMVKTILDGVIQKSLAGVISGALNGLNDSLGGIIKSIFSSVTGSSASSALGSVAGGSGGVGDILSTAGSAISSATGAVGSAISSAGSSIGSALGLTGGGGAAAATFGGSAATTSAVTGGGSVVGTALPALGAETAGSAAAAGSGSLLSIAGPIAGAAAIFSIMNSLRDNNSGVTTQQFDAAGKDITSYADMYIGQRINAQKYASTTGAMAAEYVATAKSLGITPEGGFFGYQESGNEFNAGAFFDGASYQAGWIPKNSGTVEWAKARALFAALQASEKPKSIAGFFDGVDAGLLPLEDIRLRLAQAAAAPKFALGGDHYGGLRIVGENGPELEATGPSRIFNASQTASMLRSGGATDTEIINELRAMRASLESMRGDTRRTADATNGRPEAPMIVEVET